VKDTGRHSIVLAGVDRRYGRESSEEDSRLHRGSLTGLRRRRRWRKRKERQGGGDDEEDRTTPSRPPGRKVQGRWPVPVTTRTGVD
jgi:hypothetical protein